MDKQSIKQLIEVSHAVGENPDLVQAAGGNTSVKSAEGGKMAIKASGTTLDRMSESEGWVEMDVASVLSILDRKDLPALPAHEREARVLEHLRSAVVGGIGRPSVESALHAMLDRFVIHTHAVAANALNCGPGLRALEKLSPPGEPPPLWVPYTDPGYRLAAAVRTAIQSYQGEHGCLPRAIFLENHGLLVSAADSRACLALHHEWVARCERYFSPQAPPVETASGIDSSALRKTLVELGRAWRELRGTAPFVRLSDEPELVGAARGSAVEVLGSGALTPDHIVYTGAHTILAESLEELPAKWKSALAENSPPRLAMVKGAGSFLMADDPLKLDAAEALGVSAAKITRLAAASGGAHNLSAASADFIINWEAEHYRARALDAGRAPLAGKVAMVTGAASGLGRSIAQGLVAAGAAGAFCDMDDQGAAAAAAAAADPRRTLPVHMDATSEESVAAAYDRVLKHWGRIDVAVCAAEIALADGLTEMPFDKWRRALQTNLTGYLLPAREAARIMRAQGGGGAMIILSAQTGLDASKSSTAGDAAQAAALQLMRGWAIELGRHGIRVNAVAPGNVFEDSKTWNPEAIKAEARKKGIKPEEVAPYYTSLTALKREVKGADVAAGVVFLCSDAARCITGQTLVIDSGQGMVR